MKKILFIDRDGTLINEPPIDYQVDSLEKLEFYPGVFQNLSKITDLLDFELVMVTNQDGLGTDSFPENTFWPAQNKMLKTLENEGIVFDDILIDRSFPEDNAPTRKPRTGLLTKYMNGDYDLANSFVLGDRITDVELAKNIGCKAIFLKDGDEATSQLSSSKLSEVCALSSTSWSDIANFLFLTERSATIERNTAETKIKVSINLDGEGRCDISTGLNFFDHMLEQIGRHSGCDLAIAVDGDLKVDEHHTIEDTAIVLGEALKKALGDKRGIERYGFCLPMDDCLAQVALDFGGRAWLMWEADFKREMIGDMPTEMFYHFFKSFSDAAACNLNIKAEGRNEHHKIEGIFKALARAIKAAIRKDPYNNRLPSTKEML
ncbi:bifunctional histidinol-phosphatase/imidazoleglycerol-phosphate dehydratase HisB [Carboxylicivirga sp. M1479]|uniref:bifunctional histidinol-phosphatase/imidazoleglycerol-phosphate dehydratase HisB n=1 Tax=Carboxylicivirga sp. M1479 TaxID=2594476 RepID=UPI0011783EBB|nr:bifunctional histidinol-phosphatase/imidazoleglycerol-phosphate dehydratase HisB [Carboxylicivirga sp. M1479]TRX72349.1 bifunctional histidinol-phosphatase/imidazoleglycerol-phosphate dehydratase HisB [Carboxylicivirga sp. M1479]